MFLLFKLKNRSGKFIKNKWTKGILVRTALLSWILIIATLLIFIIGTLPYQKEVLVERMKSEANDIAGSIGQVTATAIINNDYGFTVDHCMKIIKQSNSILYIIITRKDGFSLVHTTDGWKQETLKDDLNLPKIKEVNDEFVFSSLVGQEVFHFSYPFSYSGIDWGRINVGLSLSKYNQNIKELYYRTIWLALLSIIIGLVISIYFAKKLTAPIRQLDNVAQTIADGDLSVRVNISNENEIGRLAGTFNKMADNLKSSQDNLERKVEERTAELANINKMLQIEIKEKLLAENTLKQYNSRLQVFDKIYRGIISAKSLDEIITETLIQLPTLFNFISAAAVATQDHKTNTIIIQGVRRNQKNGNNFFNLTVPMEGEFESSESNPAREVKIINDIGQLECKNPMERDLLRDGLVSYISVPLTMEQEIVGNLSISSENPNVFEDNHKEILLYFSNQLAVAIHQAQLQIKIKTHALSLQNSLSEKEILLKEIHHRVKNNLQVISSLLYLNSKRIKDKEALGIFKDSQNRVKSIALIHERLYQSKDLGKINFKEYVERLMIDLFRSYGINQSIVKLKINMEDVHINIDNAVPCGLIINELISNSLKYAFPDKGITEKENIINIEFNKNCNKELQLVVRDNGVGINSKTNEKKESSLGLHLVNTLVDQLEGTLETETEEGTSYIIKFRESNS